jgi:hypothetical protein
MKRPELRHVSVNVDPELFERLEKHRTRLDSRREEGVEMTTISAALRNLILRGLDVAEAEDRRPGR